MRKRRQGRKGLALAAAALLTAVNFMQACAQAFPEEPGAEEIPEPVFAIAEQQEPAEWDNSALYDETNASEDLNQGTDLLEDQDAVDLLSVDTVIPQNNSIEELFEDSDPDDVWGLDGWEAEDREPYSVIEEELFEEEEAAFEEGESFSGTEGFSQETEAFTEEAEVPGLTEEASFEEIFSGDASLPVLTDIWAAEGWVAEQMRQRKGTICLRFEDQYSEINYQPDQIIDDAIHYPHVRTADTGDYLAYQVGGYSVEVQTVTENAFAADITYTVDYYTTLEQEEELTAALDTAWKEIAPEGKTDYEIIRDVYAYICEHVTYDNIHVNDDSYKLAHTAYAALVNGTAVCQGYAVLLYRMLMEQGIDCRIMAGEGNGGAHVWNIAKIGQQYYYLDATWDAGTSSHTEWFLKGSANFEDHDGSSDPIIDTYQYLYPISEEDYVPESEPEVLTGSKAGLDYRYDIARGSLWINGAEDETLTDWFPDDFLPDGWNSPDVNLLSNVRRITLGPDVPELNRVLGSFSNVTAFEVAEENPYLTAADGVVFSKDLSEMIYLPYGRGGTYTVPEGVRTIASTVRNIRWLTQVTFSDTVETIKEGAFDGCLILSSAIIPASVKTIGARALSGSDSLTIYGYTGTAAETHALANNIAFSAIGEAGEDQLEDRDGICGDHLTWTYDPQSLTLTISGTGMMYNNPVSHEGGWLNVRNDFDHVVIEEGVTSIGAYAFTYNERVKYITLPASLKYIGEEAFFMSVLQQVTFAGDSLTIEKGAFSGCSVKELQIPSGTKIGEYAFSNCHSLESVEITGDAPTIIGRFAFSQCPNLKNLLLGDQVVSIGDGAFADDTSLTGILQLPAGLVSIEVTAFLRSGVQGFSISTSNSSFMAVDGVLLDKSGKTLLIYPSKKAGSYLVPAGVEVIGESAFEECKDVTSVTLQEGVTDIKRNAFEASGLTGLSLPASVTTVVEGALMHCMLLKDLQVDSENPYFSAVGNVLFDKNGTTLLQYPDNQGAEYTIPDGVKKIAPYAFFRSEQLCTVHFPAGLKEIGLSAFERCSGLTSIIFPEGIVTIGPRAFMECGKWKSLTLPASVSSIGSQGIPPASIDFVLYVYKPSYAYNYAVENNYIYEVFGQNEQYEDPVNGSCGKEAKWSYDKETGTLTVSGSGAMEDYDSYDIPWARLKASIRKVVIGSGITRISRSAFEYCMNLTQAELPASLRMIGSCAFNGCRALERCPIPEGVESIDFSAFSDTGLKTVEIPDSVTSLGESAFDSNQELESVLIGEGIRTIEGTAFANCPKLTEVMIGANVSSINGTAFFSDTTLEAFRVSAENENITSVDGVLYDKAQKTLLIYPSGRSGEAFFAPGTTAIGEYAFSGCHKVTSVTLPDTLLSIGDSAFSNLLLDEVVLPDSVNHLGIGVFTSGRSLRSVRFGSGLKEIPEMAFYKCFSLVKVEIPDTIEKISSKAFAECDMLKTVQIGSGSTLIDEQAFWADPRLERFDVSDANPAYKSIDGILYNKAGTKLIQYPQDKRGELFIGAQVSTISKGALDLAMGLTAIEVEADNPNYMSRDGVLFDKTGTMLLFYPEGKMGAYSVPAGVSEIGDAAFSYCFELTEITFPDSLKRIGKETFIQTPLTSVIFPSSLISIGFNSFEEITGLQEITFLGHAPQMEAGCFMFSDCTIYYPSNSPTWTEDYKRFHFGQGFLWVPFTADNLPRVPVDPDNPDDPYNPGDPDQLTMQDCDFYIYNDVGVATPV